MNSTQETLAPLAPSVADLAALPSKVADLLKMMNDAGNHLQSVGVTVQRLGAGESSSGSSVQPTSFRVRVGRLHLRFVRRKAPSARRLWPQTGRPWRPWRRPQQGRLRGPLPASARCRSMRGCRHRWPLRGRLRWQPWRASSSHRVPPPFCSVLQVSTASPRSQIAAMNGVTERAFPVGRDTELGLWWAKKAADWPVGCHIIHDTAVHVQPTSLQFPWEPGVVVFAACECFLGGSVAA